MTDGQRYGGTAVQRYIPTYIYPPLDKRYSPIISSICGPNKSDMSNMFYSVATNSENRSDIQHMKLVARNQLTQSAAVCSEFSLFAVSIAGWNFFVRGFFAVGQFAVKKMLVSVRLSQVRLGQIRLGQLGSVFFLTANCPTANCPTAKNPRAELFAFLVSSTTRYKYCLKIQLAMSCSNEMIASFSHVLSHIFIQLC